MHLPFTPATNLMATILETMASGMRSEAAGSAQQQQPIVIHVETLHLHTGTPLGDEVLGHFHEEIAIANAKAKLQEPVRPSLQHRVAGWLLRSH